MDASCSYTSDDKQTRDLTVLFDVFGAVLSLEDIASAYCSAGGDVNATGETLYELQQSKSNDGFDKHNSMVAIEQFGKSSQDDIAERSIPLYKNPKGLKPQKSSASMGTVSTVLGKDYFGPTCSSTGASKATKPLIFELKEPSIDKPVVGKAESDPAYANKEIEEFLLSMLGDGFKLDADKIRGVLGSCGYDVRKSMEELLETSPSNLEKGKLTENFTARNHELEPYLSEEDFPSLGSAQRNVREPSIIDKKRSELPKEVLETLFNVPKRSEDVPTRTRLAFGLNRTKVIGQKPACVPVDVIDTKSSTESASAHKSKVGEDEEDNYEVLRRAAKLHWMTMKAYYEAAINEFTKGDRTKANYLLEQGKFYNRMAREADEKSAGEIVEMRSPENPIEVTLDLHCHHPKGAIRQLKCHLKALAGIPSIQFLKVTVDTDAESSNNGKRKRLVMKFLETEAIKWTPVEGNAGTILIHADVINPRKLSFVKD